MARPWSHGAGACSSSQHGPCQWAGIFSLSPAWSWDFLGSRKVPAAKTQAPGGGPGGTASPPQPWCCVAAPCPAWLLKYCFDYYFFFSILPLPVFLLVGHQLVAGVAQRWSGGCAQGTWCSPSAVSSERRTAAGDDARGLKPLPAGVGLGLPRGCSMRVLLWLNWKLSEMVRDSGSAPGSEELVQELECCSDRGLATAHLRSQARLLDRGRQARLMQHPLSAGFRLTHVFAFRISWAVS